ncbi:hypothetical protein BO78DRAFT_195881 [Aspergillus sclerotiicarbonarius CBS 121057]|uniref:Uncharacterized protein n=1 Tax=Aspergillus sclerotiicarbonarius (strain CBS 121057 / IBT 28362) TaxID=1448318 RepID=A0A319E0A3_ASPSB|nr:hypothetical protein BO78DRAFT_195881 [Aspergillus sclerotiicarbonarius CBS 121057]
MSHCLMASGIWRLWPNVLPVNILFVFRWLSPRIFVTYKAIVNQSLVSYPLRQIPLSLNVTRYLALVLLGLNCLVIAWYAELSCVSDQKPLAPNPPR